MIRLGVNIDHVATVRNARGGSHPDPLRAALLAEQAGADGITAHLREDRRHIRDKDMRRLREALSIPLNFEMAATEEMQALALELRPHAVCLVPEKREEITTEGGLEVVSRINELRDYITPLREAGIRVSLFIEPDQSHISASAETGAEVVELHTGAYCLAKGAEQDALRTQIEQAAAHAHACGLEVHAGHGLDYETVGNIAAIKEIQELNIGHFLMGEALFVGLAEAIKQMRQCIAKRRS